MVITFFSILTASLIASLIAFLVDTYSSGYGSNTQYKILMPDAVFLSRSIMT